MLVVTAQGCLASGADYTRHEDVTLRRSSAVSNLCVRKAENLTL